jgi:NitT/TauT family transport system substrate-binding protein
MRKTTIIILLTILLLTVGCEKKEPELEKMSLALDVWIGYGIAYLADEKGFFKDEGLQITFVDETLDSARREAFKAGMLDAEGGTIDLLVAKRAFDTPIVAVMETDSSLGGDGIIAAAEIQKLEDLIGKRVAFARDDSGESFLAYLFYKQNLPMNSITIIPTTTETAPEPFLDGQADAVATWEPMLSQALQRPGAHVLVSSKEMPGIIVDTLNVREDLVINRPGLVKKLMRGWLRGVDYYNTNPYEASAIMGKHYGLTPEEFMKQAKKIHWSSYAEQTEYMGAWADVFDTLAEIKFQNKRIPKKPVAEDAIRPELLVELYNR